MIITRTPFRVSLFGGGSDYPSWIRDHGGRVLGFAIDKYCYISVRELPPFFEYKHRIVHSKIELVNVADEIQHPAIRGVLNCFPPDGGIEIHHAGDLPARSGLGSSSSFSVGMINAIQTLSGICLDHKQLACEAMHLEQDVLREHVGCQDQIWAAHGGFNRIDFAKDGAYTLKPLSHQTETLSHLTNHLMLFFSGFSRFASKIAERLIANLSNREAHILRMMDMVDDAEAILDAANPELSDIGRLLDESWWLKRELADEVSTSAIDDIYAAARDAGAVGGKVLGAGGGGFIVFYVEPEFRQRVRERLRHLVEVKIGIDYEGAVVAIDEPQRHEARYAEPGPRNGIGKVGRS